MRLFADLFDELDSTTSTNEKVDALKKYFQVAPPADAMWAVLLLTGRLSRRTVTSRTLSSIFLHFTKYPEWLYVESYSHVGDTAETLSLLAHSLNLCREVPSEKRRTLSEWMEKEIPSLAEIKDADEQGSYLMMWWRELTYQEIFVLNKLITGAFRVGVSEKLVIRALSEVFGVATDQIAHRLTGQMATGTEAFKQLVSTEDVEISFSQPYPFCLAHPWSERKEQEFRPQDWCVEWKYDGIRAQIIRRENEVWIWSRGEEQMTNTFPDLVESFKALPEGTVIDGEILVYKDGVIFPFQDLQQRLGRKKVSAQMLLDKPAGFFAYDCLEYQGKDIRPTPLRERKKILSLLIQDLEGPQVQLSSTFEVSSAEALNELRQVSRDQQAEGLMLKLWEGAYTVGRKTGNWWKYKVDPLTLDAVLLYAQAGTGRRSNLYTDYTFALWDEEGKLVPFAKAYSGLDQKEIDELDVWIRRHTQEKFGPVRSVTAEQVFEIGFEGIAESKRHKSGIAVRFPRILRWRRDKKADQADTLKSAQELLNAAGKHGRA